LVPHNNLWGGYSNKSILISPFIYRCRNQVSEALSNLSKSSGETRFQAQVFCFQNLCFCRMLIAPINIFWMNKGSHVSIKTGLRDKYDYPYLKGGNWDSDWLSNLPKVTQLIVQNEDSAQVFPTWRPMVLKPLEYFQPCDQATPCLGAV